MTLSDGQIDVAWPNQTRDKQPPPVGPLVLFPISVIFLATPMLLIQQALARFGGEKLKFKDSTVPWPMLLKLLAASAFAIPVGNRMPILGKPVSEKMYRTFFELWPRYVAEHQEPRDRVAHFLEITGVFLWMALDPRRLAAFISTFTVAPLLTRPLLCVPVKKAEMLLMAVIGGFTSHFFGAPTSYALGYSVWLTFDGLGHIYWGENGEAAEFMGDHYLSWALWGQARLGLSLARHLPSEIRKALTFMPPPRKDEKES